MVVRPVNNLSHGSALIDTRTWRAALSCRGEEIVLKTTRTPSDTGRDRRSGTGDGQPEMTGFSSSQPLGKKRDDAPAPGNFGLLRCKTHGRSVPDHARGGHHRKRGATNQLQVAASLRIRSRTE